MESDRARNPGSAAARVPLKVHTSRIFGKSSVDDGGARRRNVAEWIADGVAGCKHARARARPNDVDGADDLYKR